MFEDSLILKESKKFRNDISNLFNNKDSCDVKIISGSGEETKFFFAHSLILRTRSKYFNTAFSKSWSEWNKKTSEGVVLFKKENVSPPIFKIILE